MPIHSDNLLLAERLFDQIDQLTFPTKTNVIDVLAEQIQLAKEEAIGLPTFVIDDKMCDRLIFQLRDSWENADSNYHEYLEDSRAIIRSWVEDENI